MSEPAGYASLNRLTRIEGSWESADRTQLRSALTLLAKCCGVAVLYYFMVAISMKLRVSTSTLALLWPSNALLVATLLVSSRRHWWIYVLAVIPAHIAAMHSYNIGIGWLTYQVVANSVLAITAAGILRRFKPEVLYFETLNEVVAFLIVAIAVPGLVSFVLIYPALKISPIGVLLAHGWSRDFGTVWVSRWITNSASLMVFVPAMLVTYTRGVTWIRELSLQRFAEGVFLTALMIALTFQVYGHVYVAGTVPATVYLLPIPFLLWAAIRFGSVGTCLSITALVCISGWCLYLGRGPSLTFVSFDRVTMLQMCWMMVAAPMLILAAVISERKAATLASHESEARFRYLFNEAPIGIALEDMSGNLLFANPALGSMLGYSPQELIGMNCSEFAKDEDEKEDWEEFQALRAGVKQSYQIEKRYLRKDGGEMWGRLNVSILSSGEAQPIVVATVEDITEKKEAIEELENAHAELQRLTPRLLSAQEDERRRIARELHDDIGQRLSLWMMKLDVLGIQMASEKAVEHLEIRKILAGLSELITDVHNMSHQLHSSKLEHLGLRIALNDVCRQLAEQHHIVINFKTRDVPDNLPEDVSLAFYRIAQEALRNAVKHSRSVKIDVSLMHEGEALRLKVRDFGVGFDPARQRDGLGLITMQERARMIRGTICFNSVPGIGTELEAQARVDCKDRGAQAA
jgi:PAS domain S-box-containing protein